MIIMTNKPNRLLYITLGIVVVVVAVFIFIMWKIGLFDFAGSDSSATVIGAALALVGTLIAAVIAFIGTILKQSYDQQAEQRLKLEASVRAIQLFSTSEGKKVPEIQRDGALFTLANLGQYRLTLQLVDNVLEKGTVKESTASDLLDLVIRNGNIEEKEAAMDILRCNVSYMVTEYDTILPDCLYNWIPGLPDYVREWAPLYVAEMILLRSITKWREEYYEQITPLITTLCMAWIKEKRPLVKNDIGVVLNTIFGYLPFTGEGKYYHPRMIINAEKIRDEVAGCVLLDSSSDEVKDIIERFYKWASTSDEKKPRKTQKKRKQ